ncbi:MAG: hypothetical protein NWE82_00330 [Candidatus Bathyarchaeota archaeon]|nr:hypothetical protein [Candidatus Bathyarchaeota archaeon]
MKHRRVLIGSIILIAVGLPLWLAIGPALASMGIDVQIEESGWWIFKEKNYVYYETPMYWLGFGLTLGGLMVFAIGVALLPIVLVLEKTKGASEAIR